MNIEPIAVTGVSVLLPGSADTTGFWRDVLAGKDLIRDVPESHWSIPSYYDPDPAAPDKVYSRRGGFIPPVPFDPLAHGLPPAVLSVTDNAQLLGLIVAERVLQDAAHGEYLHVDRNRISVILGATGTTELTAHMAGRLERPRWEAGLRACGLEEPTVRRLADRIAEEFTPWQENTFPGFLGNVIAGRIANRLDLGGTNCIVDAACASSLAAVSMAVAELTAGGSDLVITGGVDALNIPLMYMAFSKTGALSRTGDCRPFSDGADGTILGEGVAMFALRRLADAERDGDRIYAVLRGMGSSSDGRSKSIYAPAAEGQARAIGAAYQSAGFSPSTVELIEAHGTATVKGDKAEFHGLKLAFEAGQPGERRGQWCALGSIKSQIGHTRYAAGAAGLFKAVMALHHKVLPPTIKVEKPSAELSMNESPFYLNTRLRPWVRDGEHPRRAGVSSVGFGGTNFHVALEEYTGPAPRARRVRCSPSELVLAAADTPAELARSCEQLLAECEKWGQGVEGLQALARRSQEGHSPGPQARLALVAGDIPDLLRKLHRARSVLRERPDQELYDPSGIYLALGKQPGEVAFLFPGQGSQYPGMGLDLAVAFDEARAVWDLAASLDLDPELRLHDVVFPRPVFTPAEEAEQAARLTRTEWAQPALAACSMAYLEVLRLTGLEPDHLAGHSFGELSALCTAGAFGVRELIELARRRGELTARSSDRPGLMVAVRAPAEQVERLLGGRHPEVVLANRNSPQQVVLSGPLEAVTAAAELTAASLIVKRLPTSAAFHSPQVGPAMEAFLGVLRRSEMRAPGLPVYANATAGPYPAGAEEARELLGRQLGRPVRFQETVERLAAQGVRTFVEVGPGAVLTGLVRECLQGQDHLAVALDRKGLPGLTALWQALGQLAVQGVVLRWERLWESHPEIVPPRAVPAHAVSVSGASKGFRGDVVRPSREANSETEGSPTPRQPVESARSALVPAAVHLPRRGAGPAAESASVFPLTTAPPCNGTARVAPKLPEQLPLHGTTRPDAASTSGKGGSNGAPHSPLVSAQPPAGRVDAVRDILRETAQAHQRYLELVDRSVQALVGVRQASPRGLIPDFQPMSPHGLSQFEPSETPLAGEMDSGFPQRGSGESTSLAIPTALESAKQPRHGNGSLLSPTPTAPTRIPVEATAAVADAPTPGRAAALEGAVLRVVAEQTGYPAELLNLGMEIEADLGIDSIKRVEILVALGAAVPALAGADRSRMAGLRTLGDFRDLLLRSGPGQAAPVHGSLQEKAAPQREEDPSQTAAPPSCFPRQVVSVAEAPALGFRRHRDDHTPVGPARPERHHRLDRHRAKVRAEHR